MSKYDITQKPQYHCTSVIHNIIKKGYGSSMVLCSAMTSLLWPSRPVVDPPGTVSANTILLWTISATVFVLQELLGFNGV